MKIFETKRILVRNLQPQDADAYYDMMGNPNVMDLIPRPMMSRTESDAHLKGMLQNVTSNSDTRVWAMEYGNELIGICAFLKNDQKEEEIGYRLREQFWQKGFGTEIAKGLIDFGFQELNMEKITADVAIQNLNSIKILEKLMSLQQEFYNPDDQCMDRRYEIFKTDGVKS
jgi:RimJ/RimL family protein N-acetyltransferase